MAKKLWLLAALLTVFCLAFTLGACNSDSDRGGDPPDEDPFVPSPNDPDVELTNLSLENKTLPVGEELVIAAVKTPENGYIKSAAWTIEGDAATVTKLGEDAGLKATVEAGDSAGEVTVKLEVVTKDDKTVNAECTISITEPGPGDGDDYDVTPIIFVPDNRGAWDTLGVAFPEGGWIGFLQGGNGNCLPKDGDGHDKSASWDQICAAPVGSFLRVQIRKSPTDDSTDSQDRDWLHVYFYNFIYNPADGSKIDQDWANLESEDDDPLTFNGNDPLTIDFDLYDDQGNHKLKMVYNSYKPEVNAFYMYANNGYEFYEELELHEPK